MLEALEVVHGGNYPFIMSQFDGKLDQSNPSGNIAFKIYFDKFNDLSLAQITLLGLWPTKCTQESLRFCDRENIRKVHISKKKP